MRWETTSGGEGRDTFAEDRLERVVVAEDLEVGLQTLPNETGAILLLGLENDLLVGDHLVEEQRNSISRLDIAEERSEKGASKLHLEVEADLPLVELAEFAFEDGPAGALFEKVGQL